jgi:hypothetical protein
MLVLAGDFGSGFVIFYLFFASGCALGAYRVQFGYPGGNRCHPNPFNAQH